MDRTTAARLARRLEHAGPKPPRAPHEDPVETPIGDPPDEDGTDDPDDEDEGEGDEPLRYRDDARARVANVQLQPRNR